MSSHFNNFQILVLSFSSIHTISHTSSFSGVAVKVNLIINGKTVKSKKTSVNKSQLDAPVFNESFVFEISNDVLDRISFIVIVYAYNGNVKRVVGKANTGPYMYSTGVGLTQWNDMLMQPRKAIAEWHKLM